MDCLEVVLVDMPRMLHDIVKGLISADAGMRVSADLADASGLREALSRQPAHLVIAGAEAVDPADVDELLAERPRVRVLTIDGDGRDAVLYELRPHRVRLGEVSPERLLATIRPAAGG